MKKALLLTGLFLCSTGLYAASKQSNSISEGKKRNEEAYERMLEQTGWKNEASTRLEKVTQPVQPNQLASSQPKSS